MQTNMQQAGSGDSQARARRPRSTTAGGRPQASPCCQLAPLPCTAAAPPRPAQGAEAAPCSAADAAWRCVHSAWDSLCSCQPPNCQPSQRLWLMPGLCASCRRGAGTAAACARCEASGSSSLQKKIAETSCQCLCALPTGCVQDPSRVPPPSQGGGAGPDRTAAHQRMSHMVLLAAPTLQAPRYPPFR